MKENFVGIGILVGIAVLLGVAYSFNTGYLESTPKKYDAFVQCLAEKDVTFYGAWWCPACTRQKAILEGSIKKELPYVECSSPGTRYIDNQVCIDQKIRSTPTWSIPDHPYRYNVLPREALSLLSSCSLELAGETALEDRTGEEVLESILGQISPKILNNEQALTQYKKDFTDSGIDLTQKTGIEIIPHFLTLIQE